MTVLIVGAGPTGLTLALSLSRQGIPYHLLETPPQGLPTELGESFVSLSPRSLEIFDLLGVADGLEEKGYPVEGLAVYPENSRKIDFDFKDIEATHPSKVSLSAQDFSTALTQASKLKIDTETKLLGLASRDKGVEAHLQVDGTTKKKTFDYVVGCDDTSDMVRQLFSETPEERVTPLPQQSQDNDSEGRAQPMTASPPSTSSVLVVDLTYEGASFCRDELHFLKETTFLSVMPLSKNQLRLVMGAPKDGQGPVTEDDFASLLNQESLSQGSSPDAFKVKKIMGRQVHEVVRPLENTFQQGNAFFCGRTDFYDCSRLSFGLDLDIQKAFRLGCFMGQALRHGKTPHILDAYEDERRFFRAQDRKLQKKIASFLFSKGGFASFIKANLFPLVLSCSCFKKKILKHLGGLDICYRLTRSFKEVIADYYVNPFGPKKGDLAPEVTFTTHKGETHTLSSLLRNFKTVALVFSERDPVELDYSDLGVRPEHTYWIASFLNDPQQGTLQDSEGEAFKRYGIKKRSLLYVVRPDGHIAERRLLF